MKNKLKSFIIVIALVLINVTAWACPVCESQQPKITQGFTHGGGPGSNWDWVIIGVISAITVATLIYSVKFLVKPGEKNANHIKQFILNN